MSNFTKLNRANMKGLKSGEKIQENGIIYTKLSNGDAVFSINIMVDGKRIHRVVGRESRGTTRTQAEDYINKLYNEAKEERLNLPKGRKNSLNFNQAFNQYIEVIERTDGKDIRNKKHRFKNHLDSYFGKIPLTKINEVAIAGYKKLRETEQASTATINLELAVVSHLLHKAVEWGWINNMPCRIVKEQLEESDKIYLTKEQVNDLIESAKHDQNPQIYMFIRIGFETAMRKMEILSIKIKDIHIENNRIYIPDAKAGARMQPITAGLAEQLKVYIENLKRDNPSTEWLFPSTTAKNGHTIDIRKAFVRCVQRANLDIEKVTPHTMRHTAITHLVQNGVDLLTVQHISGHKTLKMVQHYFHQNGKHIDDAMSKLEKAYQNTSQED